MAEFASIPWNVHARIIWTSLGMGAVGVPGAFALHSDVSVLLPTWIALSGYLVDECALEIDKDALTKVVTGVLTAVSMFMLGVKGATTAAAYTGVGTFPAILANVGLNGLVTYAYGRALYTVLTDGSDFRNVDRIIARIRDLVLSMFSGWR